MKYSQDVDRNYKIKKFVISCDFRKPAVYVCSTVVEQWIWKLSEVAFEFF